MDDLPIANSAKRQRRLWDAYAFPGFRPQSTVRGVFLGSASWWILLATGAGWRRNKLIGTRGSRLFRVINIVAGVTILCFALWQLAVVLR